MDQFEIVFENFPFADVKYATRIEAILQENNIVYSGIAISRGTLTIYVPNKDQETNIRQLAAQFEDTIDKPTPKEQARTVAIQDGVNLIKAIANKPRVERTNQEKIALALALYVSAID